MKKVAIGMAVMALCAGMAMAHTKYSCGDIKKNGCRRTSATTDCTKTVSDKCPTCQKTYCENLENDMRKGGETGDSAYKLWQNNGC